MFWKFTVILKNYEFENIGVLFIYLRFFRKCSNDRHNERRAKGFAQNR